MKYVEMLIESPFLKEYLRNKLEENGIKVIAAGTPMEGIAKMRNFAPDLIILDFSIGKQSLMELLKLKKDNINTVRTPVIILTEIIDQRHLVELASFNVKNVFTKPMKVDALFAALSKLLQMSFRVDHTHSIMEVTVNENIIFIEIANGLNEDKIDLLHFKIDELFAIYRIRVPKVIIMLSDIRLNNTNAVDNLHKLLQVVFKASKAAKNCVKILTKDNHIQNFIREQKEYSKIEVVEKLQSAIEYLLEVNGSTYASKEIAELIESKLHQAKPNQETEAAPVKSDVENKLINFELGEDSMKGSRIAVVDDDFIIQELIKNTFEKTGAIINTFSDGQEFLAVIDTLEFDLVFLDINMPIVGGFDVLSSIKGRNIRYPIIILSSVNTRDAMVKAIQMGVKSYLVKPLKPEDILRKSIEILKANF